MTFDLQYIRAQFSVLSQAQVSLIEAFLACAFDSLEDEAMRESLLEKQHGWLAR